MRKMPTAIRQNKAERASTGNDSHFWSLVRPPFWLKPMITIAV